MPETPQPHEGEGFVAPNETKSQPALDLKFVAQKIEAAKAAQGQLVDQKIVNREQLIGEAKTNAEQLQEAESLLSYYQEQQDAGLLEGEAAVGFSELQRLVETLRGNTTTINQGIDAISSDEKVIDRLQDEATGVDTERKLEQLVEHWEEEFGPETDGLARFIVESVEKYERDQTQDAEKNTARESTMAELSNQYDATRQQLKPQFNQFISSRISNLETDQVSAALEKAGFFDGASKKLLEKLTQIHEDWLQQSNAYSETANAHIGSEQEDFIIKFHEFMDHINVRVVELGGDKKVSSAISSRARQHIEDKLTGADLKMNFRQSVQALEWYTSKVRHGY